jgi:hypothetical protein
VLLLIHSSKLAPTRAVENDQPVTFGIPTIWLAVRSRFAPVHGVSIAFSALNGNAPPDTTPVKWPTP